MKLHLVVIDPQYDFCDPNGSLFVPEADNDMKRLAVMVERLSPN
jgi:nicotinamidase-related amidase